MAQLDGCWLRNFCHDELQLMCQVSLLQTKLVKIRCREVIGIFAIYTGRSFWTFWLFVPRLSTVAHPFHLVFHADCDCDVW